MKAVFIFLLNFLIEYINNLNERQYSVSYCSINRFNQITKPQKSFFDAGQIFLLLFVSQMVLKFTSKDLPK